MEARVRRDKRVREALNYAVNKEALCKVVYQGFAAPATGIAPEGVDYAEAVRRVALRPGEGEGAPRRGGLPQRL